MSLDCVLAAKCACVSGVLSDFHLLYLLAEGGTISRERGQALTEGGWAVERDLVPYLPVTPTSVQVMSAAIG